MSERPQEERPADPAPPSAAAALPQAVELLVIQLGSELCALPVEPILEILPLPALTPVPRTSPALLGVGFRRSRILPVVDGARKLGLHRDRLPEATTSSQRPPVLVLRTRLGEMGLLVDRVHRLARVAREAIREEAGGGRSVAVESESARLIELEELDLEHLLDGDRT